MADGNPEKRDLAELIRLCKKRNRDAQKAIYLYYHKKMFALCLRYAGDFHLAEDFLQDGFIRVFTQIDKYSGHGSFEGWMRRVIINTCIEQLRRSAFIYPLLDHHQENLTEDFNHDSELLPNFTYNELLKMVQELPAGYRTIFNLYAIEGYNHREISEMLNISEGTSKSQVARARIALQKKISVKKAVLKKGLG